MLGLIQVRNFMWRLHIHAEIIKCFFLPALDLQHSIDFLHPLQIVSFEWGWLTLLLLWEKISFFCRFRKNLGFLQKLYKMVFNYCLALIRPLWKIVFLKKAYSLQLILTQLLRHYHGNHQHICRSCWRTTSSFMCIWRTGGCEEWNIFFVTFECFHIRFSVKYISAW